jgi:hypothetical protein
VSRAGELSGYAALVKFGDQAVIGDGQSPPLRLDPAEQIEQLVTIEAGQVELTSSSMASDSLSRTCSTAEPVSTRSNIRASLQGRSRASQGKIHP